MTSTPQGHGPRLLTTTEVAQALYVHPRTVTRWAKSGKLRSVVTPGGQRRFTVAELQRHLSGQVRSDGATSAEAMIAAAAETARRVRLETDRAVDALLANEAARQTVATRLRLAAEATRGRGAAATSAFPSVAGDPATAACTAETLARIRGASTKGAKDADWLAESVAVDVAAVAELIRAIRARRERTIEALWIDCSIAVSSRTRSVPHVDWR